MTIHFNIENSPRKALAHRIGELMGAEVRYCGVPSCTYQIGNMMLAKDTVLTDEEDEITLITFLNVLQSEENRCQNGWRIMCMGVVCEEENVLERKN